MIEGDKEKMKHLWEWLLGWRPQDDDDEKTRGLITSWPDPHANETRGEMRRRMVREKAAETRKSIYVGVFTGAVGGAAVLLLQHLIGW